jgi:hypothetical protein
VHRNRQIATGVSASSDRGYVLSTLILVCRINCHLNLLQSLASNELVLSILMLITRYYLNVDNRVDNQMYYLIAVVEISTVSRFGSFDVTVCPHDCLMYCRHELLTTLDIYYFCYNSRLLRALGNTNFAHFFIIAPKRARY